MQPGSIVEYIGGQCPKGRVMYPLEKDTPYMITAVGTAPFEGIVKASVMLEGTNFSFWAPMFKEILPSEAVSIEELLKEEIST